jgi:hypothetical protein
MPKKKPTSNKRTSARVGNISDVSGTVNVAGANITTYHAVTGLSAAEIKQLFDALYSNIDARANTSLADKEDIKAEVKEIQSSITATAQKNEKVDEAFLSRRFRNIARMAPDVLAVNLRRHQETPAKRGRRLYFPLKKTLGRCSWQGQRPLPSKASATAPRF